MISEKELTATKKSVYTTQEITPLFFDLICTIKDIKAIETVDSVYLNIGNEKFEFYIFYEKENFEIENRITKLIVDWETDYCYFPEVFIYPLDTIESKALALPASAEEM